MLGGTMGFRVWVRGHVPAHVLASLGRVRDVELLADATAFTVEVEPPGRIRPLLTALADLGLDVLAMRRSDLARGA
jgi:hypothetical protein